MAALRTLTAKNNRITSTAGLPANLRSLDLTGNPVAELAGIDSLSSLTELTVTGGKLTALAGAGAPAMQTLCVEENAITSTEGIEGATALTTVLARSNRIASLAGLSEGHEQLATLDLRENDLKSRRIWLRWRPCQHFGF